MKRDVELRNQENERLKDQIMSKKSKYNNSSRQGSIGNRPEQGCTYGGLGGTWEEQTKQNIIILWNQGKSMKEIASTVGKASSQVCIFLRNRGLKKRRF